VLLDRALFSPGSIDGRWGMNTEKVAYWLQKREGLPATGHVDSLTFARLVELAAISRAAWWIMSLNTIHNQCGHSSFAIMAREGHARNSGLL
jgi:hypothetical protein